MYVTPTMSGYAPFYQSSTGLRTVGRGHDAGHLRHRRRRTRISCVSSSSSTRPTKSGAFDLLYGPSHPEDPRRLHRAHRAAADTSAGGVPALARPRRVSGRRAGDMARRGHEQHGRRGPAGLRRLRHPGGHLPFRSTVGGRAGGLRRVHLRSRTAPERVVDARRDGRVPVGSPRSGSHRGRSATLGDEAKAANYLAPNSPRAIDLTNPDAGELAAATSSASVPRRSRGALRRRLLHGPWRRARRAEHRRGHLRRRPQRPAGPQRLSAAVPGRDAIE